MKRLNWLAALILTIWISLSAYAADDWPPVLVCVNQTDALETDGSRLEIWHPEARQPCFHSTRIPGMVFGPLVGLDEGPTPRMLRATYYVDRFIGFLPAIAGDASTPGVFLVAAFEFVRNDRRHLLFENSQFTGDGKESQSGWMSLDLKSGAIAPEKLPGYAESDAYVTIVQDRYAIYPTITSKPTHARKSRYEDLYMGFAVLDLHSRVLKRNIVTRSRPVGQCGGQSSTIKVKHFRYKGTIGTRVDLNLNGECPENIDAVACERANLHTLVFR